MEQLTKLYLSIQFESLEQIYQLTDKGDTLLSPAKLKEVLGVTGVAELAGNFRKILPLISVISRIIIS